MAKKNHYTLFDSNAYNCEEAKEWYKEYVEEQEADELPIEDITTWRCNRTNAEFDDTMWNVEYYCGKLGAATITGSVGSWDGRHEIMPVTCKSLHDAIWKCIEKQDSFIIKIWKTKIEVDTYNHDSQYHGGNHFTIRTKEKRKSMYLW